MITVCGLRKNYGDRRVIDGVDFEVAKGEIFGIVGPNGAGKTTTVECIGGLRKRDGGDVLVAGFDPADGNPGLREVLGIQLQESRLPDKQTVGEAMRLYSSFYDSPRDWRELLDRLDMAEHERTYFGKLSGGQKQRLSVALALIGNPEVAILDELTTGLDPSARREVWALLEDLKDTGVTLLLVSHFMEEAQRLCDRVAVIDAGRVVALGTRSSWPRRWTPISECRSCPAVRSTSTSCPHCPISTTSSAPGNALWSPAPTTWPRRSSSRCTTGASPVRSCASISRVSTTHSSP